MVLIVPPSEARVPAGEIFFSPSQTTNKSNSYFPKHRTEASLRKQFEEAVKEHPFVNRSHYSAVIDTDAVFCDAQGNVVGVLLKKALPEKITSMAANVLRNACAKTTLRSNIHGGEPPHSGIAGYFDYAGSPVQYKCRKTSFTCEHPDNWHGVFPMVSYVSELYKTILPEFWERQNAAIPDVVRINGSPYSTLTINQRFRTAKHTDAGDFDAGFGCLTIMEGHFQGLFLGFPDFGVCINVQPRDVVLFNTHHFHCNTELERNDGLTVQNWSRLVCVFYYRALLGENYCLNRYRKRLREALENGHDVAFKEIPQKDNGTNMNQPAPVFKAKNLTPFAVAATVIRLSSSRRIFTYLDSLTNDNTAVMLDLFGEKPLDSWGLPPRSSAQLQSMYSVLHPDGTEKKGSILSGFSSLFVKEMMMRQKHCLDLDKLERTLPAALFEAYRDARRKWAGLLDKDWQVQLRMRPERTNYFWANNGAMNKAFFELCDVAKGVMEVLLQEHKVTISSSYSNDIENLNNQSAGGIKTQNKDYDDSHDNNYDLEKNNQKISPNYHNPDNNAYNNNHNNNIIISNKISHVNTSTTLLTNIQSPPSTPLSSSFSLSTSKHFPSSSNIPFPSNQSFFWLSFAASILSICTDELNIPSGCVTIRKLETKLRDYHSGGTRYKKGVGDEGEGEEDDGKSMGITKCSVGVEEKGVQGVERKEKIKEEIERKINENEKETGVRMKEEMKFDNTNSINNDKYMVKKELPIDDIIIENTPSHISAEEIRRQNDVANCIGTAASEIKMAMTAPSNAIATTITEDRRVEDLSFSSYNNNNNHHHREKFYIDWLNNDSFDYQEEDCKVHYNVLRVPEPEENPALEMAIIARKVVVEATKELSVGKQENATERKSEINKYENNNDENSYTNNDNEVTESSLSSSFPPFVSILIVVPDPLKRSFFDLSQPDKKKEENNKKSTSQDPYGSLFSSSSPSISLSKSSVNTLPHTTIPSKKTTENNPPHTSPPPAHSYFPLLRRSCERLASLAAESTAAAEEIDRFVQSKTGQIWAMAALQRLRSREGEMGGRKGVQREKEQECRDNRNDAHQHSNNIENDINNDNDKISRDESDLNNYHDDYNKFNNNNNNIDEGGILGQMGKGKRERLSLKDGIEILKRFNKYDWEMEGDNYDNNHIEDKNNENRGVKNVKQREQREKEMIEEATAVMNTAEEAYKKGIPGFPSNIQIDICTLAELCLWNNNKDFFFYKNKKNEKVQNDSEKSIQHYNSNNDASDTLRIKKYDLVIGSHLLSSSCSTDNMIVPLITMLSSHSTTTATFLIEQDLDDACQHLLFSTTEAVYNGLKHDLLRYMAALKRASGAFFAPQALLGRGVGRYLRGRGEVMRRVEREMLSKKKGKNGMKRENKEDNDDEKEKEELTVKIHGVYYFKRSLMQACCFLCSL